MWDLDLVHLTIGYGDSQTYYRVKKENLSSGQCQCLREHLGEVNRNPLRQAQIKKTKTKKKGVLGKDRGEVFGNPIIGSKEHFRFKA